jgi:REase_MTES_1575/Transcriptional regulator, AbiEi antitoxin
VDLAVAAFAARRHAVASTAELRELGLSRSGISRRVASGRLHPWHRGVFAIGHANPTPHGRWLAAVLACGGKAVLSHRSAAALWGVRPGVSGRIEVTVPGGGRPGPAEVHVHRTRCLTEDDRTIHDEIPVTSLARTLVDLAEVLPHRALKRAIHEAEVLRLLDVDAVWAAAARVSGRRRVRRLLRLLGTPAPPTRSELERRFLDLCQIAGLPRPEINVLVEGFEVDFLWRDAKLIVETDGAAVHHTRTAFERDRRRDAELTAAGYRVVRITWRQLTEDPAAVIAILRRLLTARG